MKFKILCFNCRGKMKLIENMKFKNYRKPLSYAVICQNCNTVLVDQEELQNTERVQEKND